MSKERDKFCPVCGEKLYEKDKFCISCGYSFEEREKKRSKKIKAKTIIILIILFVIAWVAIRTITGQAIFPELLAKFLKK